MNKLNKGN